ncbi:hypothetical protein DFH29DRAFT_834252 [Suillus ampliporus]|nr:hypothetical protein DFH29DRAFT_834252 [Suillus ampliporus]
MADTTGAKAGPKTPPPGFNAVPELKLKSTPNAVGSAVVSEHISTLGVEVDDVRLWIARDVEDFRKCEADAMLKELLYCCRDPSEPLPDKSTLLNACLQAVLPLCNATGDAQDIKNHLSEFVTCTAERHSYAPFVQAANCALLELSKLDAPGLISSKTHDDPNDILFHVNDPSFINQTHQGAESRRKPDVVVVSCQSARNAGKEKKDLKEKIYTKARCKPDSNFQWTDVRSTLEFKRTKNRLQLPPSTYQVKDSNPSDQKYMDYRIRNETNDPVEPTGSTPVPAGDPTQSSHEPSSAPGRPNQSEQLKSKGDKKRTSDHLRSSEPRSKRPKSNNENKGNEKEPKKIHPIVQNGLYVAEMFAAHMARLHVISFVVNDDMLYMWYFDRQGAIQFSGINFVQDLPRFMVLLLAMQRMENAQWGFNPEFEPTPGSSGEIRVPDPEHGSVDLKFDLKSTERTTHFGLRGRATTVFPVESVKLSSLLSDSPNKSKELVAKLYWPEESRESEAEILKKVYKIAESEAQVKGHVPEMVWSHKFEGTSTANIRKALGIDDAERGSRVFYIIVFRKLIPITTLSGKEFLSAWWQIVVCHRILWTHDVHHRDISPSNLMVYETSDGRFIGVLNDYDLSSTRHGGSEPSGTERTGTVPFMAIDLLSQEALDGEVEHVYKHDAESLMWVLAWVCLRYEGGKLLGKGRPLDEWLRVDAIGCSKEKAHFLFVKLSGTNLRPTGSHEENWKIARSCLHSIVLLYAKVIIPLDDDSVFQTWFEANVSSSLLDL